MDFEDNTPSKPIAAFEFNNSPHIIEILSNDLELLLKDFSDSEKTLTIHMTFDKNVSILGTKKLLEFDYVYSIYEILILSSTFKIFELPEESTQSESYLFQHFTLKLIEQNFFATAIDNFFKYEWNNSYQKSFEELFSIVLSSDLNELYTHVFVTLNFLERIIETSIEQKFTFNSGKFINNGHLAFLVEISHKISTAKNQTILEILKECRFYLI